MQEKKESTSDIPDIFKRGFDIVSNTVHSPSPHMLTPGRRAPHIQYSKANPCLIR